MASVLLNGGLLFAAALQPVERSLVIEPQAMVVELIGPDYGVAVPDSLKSDTPKDQPAKTAASALPTPPTPAPTRLSPTPAPDPIVWRPKEVKTQDAPTPVRPLAVENAAPPPSSGRSADAPPSPVAAPPSKPAPPAGGVVNAPMALSGAQGDAYGARVRAHLEAHKIYPRGARRLRQTGVVTVRFVIDREGRVISSRIVSGSGVPALDEEAMAMLTRASPVPRPPAGVPGARIEMRTPVEFSLEN
ncbi:TonB family protein [Pseudomonas sp. ODNR1LW]|nr:TonB family protein [Pseudomonas sp. ODNR1LW]